MACGELGGGEDVVGGGGGVFDGFPLHIPWHHLRLTIYTTHSTPHQLPITRLRNKQFGGVFGRPGYEV